jgi:hypothetical protein
MRGQEKMKIMMIAALVAAPLTAAGAPAQAAGEPATQQLSQSAGTRPGLDVEQNLRDRQAAELRLASMEESPPAAAARPDEPRKKHKSTGDKVLTGAAVVLGIGALAVGGLLVAIFVN